MIIGSVVSAAATVVGQQQQARAAASAAEYQARVADQNRRLAQAQSVEAMAAGAREEGRFRRRAEQFQATQRAMLAASGAQLTGSPLQVIEQTASGIEEDVTQIRLNALRSAWGHDVQASSFLNEAQQARASAAAARRAGRTAWISGAASLISSGAQMWGTQHSSYNRGAIHVNNMNPSGAGMGALAGAGIGSGTWGAF